MPLPSTPTAITGISLTPAQIGWLSNMIQILYAPDPMRAADSILRQAVGAFQRAHRVVRGVWITRPEIQLGGVGSAILVIPPRIEA